uniref:Uncharacterized protein n=1 Tax=Romanomermis culicivorax TaxID=13658 RepID=A0A915K150_ROMCU
MSTNWWFGAFRDHGAPTWYGDNRTPVISDSTTITVSVAFGILLSAFLVIFPGIRRTVSGVSFISKIERWAS